MGKPDYNRKKAVVIEDMLDGEAHWPGEWHPDPKGNNYGHWVTILKELEAEGLIEKAGTVRAKGSLYSDGRGRPRVVYRITPYGKETADEVIAARNDTSRR